MDFSADYCGHLHETGRGKILVGEGPQQTYCQVFLRILTVSWKPRCKREKYRWIWCEERLISRECTFALSCGWWKTSLFMKVVLCSGWCFRERLRRRTTTRGEILEQAIIEIRTFIEFCEKNSGIRWFVFLSTQLLATVFVFNGSGLTHCNYVSVSMSSKW